jgi:superfamily I DNA and/or RNA helicase
MEDRTIFEIKRLKLLPSIDFSLLDKEELGTNSRGEKTISLDMSFIHIDRVQMQNFISYLSSNIVSCMANGFSTRTNDLFIRLHYKNYKILVGFYASKIYAVDQFMLEWENISLDYKPSDTIILKTTLYNEDFFILLDDLVVFKIYDDKVRTPNVVIDAVSDLEVKFISIDQVFENHQIQIKELKLEELKIVYDRLVKELTRLQKVVVLKSIDFTSLANDEPDLLNSFVLDLETAATGNEFYLPLNKDSRVFVDTFDDEISQQIINKYKLKIFNKDLDSSFSHLSFTLGNVKEWEFSDRYNIVELTIDSSLEEEIIEDFYESLLERLLKIDQEDDFVIEFSLNVFPEIKKYERVKKAIDLIEKGDVLNPQLVKNILSPETLSFADFHLIHNSVVGTEQKGLNASQQLTINKIMSMDNETHPFFFVQGPPGTGKTTVIAKLIENLYLEGKNVLVTSNTHVAIDNVIDRVRGDKDLIIHRFTTLNTANEQYDAQIITNKMNYFWNQVYSHFTIEDDFGKSFDIDSIDELYEMVRLEERKFDEEIGLEATRLVEIEKKILFATKDLDNVLTSIDDLTDKETKISKFSEEVNRNLELIDEVKSLLFYSNYLKSTFKRKIQLETDELFLKLSNLSGLEAAEFAEIKKTLKDITNPEIENGNSFYSDIEQFSNFSPRDFFDWNIKKHKLIKDKNYSDVLKKAKWLGENYDNSLSGSIKRYLGIKNNRGVSKLDYERKFKEFITRVREIKVDDVLKMVHKSLIDDVSDYLISTLNKSNNKFVYDCELKLNASFSPELSKFESNMDIKHHKREMHSSKLSIEAKLNNFENEKREFKNRIDELSFLKDEYLSKYDKLNKLKDNAAMYHVDFSLIIDFLKEIKKTKFSNLSEKLKKLDPIPTDSFEITQNGNSNMIVAMTTNQVAQIFKAKSHGRRIEFNYSIVDEASKCTLEDILVSLPNTEKMIILGDILQLVPELQEHVLLSDIDNQLLKRINQSILERFYNQFKAGNNDLSNHEKIQSVSVLTQQYRMDQPIFDLISLIYQNENITLINEKKSNDNKKSDSVLLVNTRSNSFRELNKGQYRNDDELHFIERFLNELTTENLKEKLIRENISVGIISYYRKQVNEIDALINQRKKDLKGIQLRSGSVDRFQGMEFDIVIVSSVRRRKSINRTNERLENSIGFMALRNRVNVSLSRARRKLVFLSDADFIHSLEYSDIKLNRYEEGTYIDFDDEKIKNRIVVDVFKTLLNYKIEHDDDNVFPRIFGDL